MPSAPDGLHGPLVFEEACLREQVGRSVVSKLGKSKNLDCIEFRAVIKFVSCTGKGAHTHACVHACVRSYTCTYISFPTPAITCTCMRTSLSAHLSHTCMRTSLHISLTRACAHLSCTSLFACAHFLHACTLGMHLYCTHTCAGEKPRCTVYRCCSKS